MRSRLIAAVTLVAGAAAIVAAQGRAHTLVVLSHSNHTVYEMNPATGAVVHEFVAPDQPHEAAITADGGTVFASVPAAGFVEILDGRTFTEKGRIDSDHFRRRDGKPASPHGMGLNADNTKLYIGTENADVPGVVVYDVKARRPLPAGASGDRQAVLPAPQRQPRGRHRHQDRSNSQDHSG